MVSQSLIKKTEKRDVAYSWLILTVVLKIMVPLVLGAGAIRRGILIRNLIISNSTKNTRFWVWITASTGFF